jgi:hypothetical protein
LSLATDQTLPRTGLMDFTLGCRRIAFLVILFAQLCNGQLAEAENGEINYIFMIRPKSNDLHFLRAGMKSISAKFGTTGNVSRDFWPLTVITY